LANPSVIRAYGRVNEVIAASLCLHTIDIKPFSRAHDGRLAAGTFRTATFVAPRSTNGSMALLRWDFRLRIAAFATQAAAARLSTGG
jgi:hypothetical protein